MSESKTDSPTEGDAFLVICGGDSIDPTKAVTTTGTVAGATYKVTLKYAPCVLLQSSKEEQSVFMDLIHQQKWTEADVWLTEAAKRPVREDWTRYLTCSAVVVPGANTNTTEVAVLPGTPAASRIEMEKAVEARPFIGVLLIRLVLWQLTFDSNLRETQAALWTALAAANVVYMAALTAVSLAAPQPATCVPSPTSPVHVSAFVVPAVLSACNAVTTRLTHVVDRLLRRGRGQQPPMLVWYTDSTTALRLSEVLAPPAAKSRDGLTPDIIANWTASVGAQLEYYGMCNMESDNLFTPEPRILLLSWDAEFHGLATDLLSRTLRKGHCLNARTLSTLGDVTFNKHVIPPSVHPATASDDDDDDDDDDEDTELVEQRHLYLRWMRDHPPKSDGATDVMRNEADFSIETGSKLFELMYDQDPSEALVELTAYQADIAKLKGKLELVFELGDGAGSSAAGSAAKK